MAHFFRFNIFKLLRFALDLIKRKYAIAWNGYHRSTHTEAKKTNKHQSNDNNVTKQLGNSDQSSTLLKIYFHT